MHTEIEYILKLPCEFNDIGFVVSTNGMLHSGMNSILQENGWLVAVSIHGNREAHNSYVQTDSFELVTARIRVLSELGVALHLYSVINNHMTNHDIDWLLQFRDDVCANFLRFIAPRPYGRSEPLINSSLVVHACRICDQRANVVFDSSNTLFFDKNGNQRWSN